MNDQTIRVLLIEDDPDDVTLIRHFLSEANEPGPQPRFTLKTADRLSGGCKALADEAFDVVLLDFVLPGGVGIEAFAKLKEARAQVPIVVLTGLKDEALAVQAMGLGAQDYLVKGTIDAQLLKRSLIYARERGRLLARLEGLLNADADGKVVVDTAGVARYINPAAESLLSRKSKDALGKPLPLEFLAGGGDVKLADGGRIVEARSCALEWEGREARLVTLRDVTELRRVEQLREEVKERMLAIDLKNEFMTTISHELRNPLTTVKTAVQSLRDGLVGPMTAQQRRFIDLAHRNVERQIRIINNVLDLARLQSGRAHLDLRRVQVALHVEEALQAYSLSDRGPRVETVLAPDLPDVKADPDLLTQVLTNLVDNARRYARERVTVRVAPSPEGVVLSVIDDGPGLADSQAAKLFSKFVQVNRPTGGGYKGTGLGLAICKEIVAAHGGRIWADGGQGKGARFHTVWPAFAAEPQAAGR